MTVTYGNNRSMNSRSRNVGTEASEHDLVGDIIMMWRTAASVNGWNDDSDDDARLMTGGGARPEVADRMLSIVFTAQCTLVQMRGIGIACRPSVCPSVTLVICDYIGWKS